MFKYMKFMLLFIFMSCHAYAQVSVKPPALSPISNAQLAGEDLFLVWDNSVGVTKKMSVTEMDLRFAPVGNYITSLTGDVTGLGPGAASTTIASGAITNTKVSASAAIAYSKLNLTGSILDADINLFAAISLSKIQNLTSYSASPGVVASGDSIQDAIEKLDGNISLLAFPPGMVSGFGLTSCPSGWLAADGSTVSRTTYATLFAAMGTIHGTGDGSTTFNLPDYRGRFLRGVDGTANRDPDKASRTAMNSGGNTANNVGSVQAGEFASHTHVQNSHNHINGSRIHTVDTSVALFGVSGEYAGNGWMFTVGSNGANVRSPITSGTAATNQNTGGNENRPINAYVLYCVKI